MSKNTCTLDGCNRPQLARHWCSMHYQRWLNHGDLHYELSRLDRFMVKVNKTDTCWLWIAGCDDRGYGRFWAGKRLILAYRWSYEHFIGPIAEDLELDHLCRVHACVNPAHLEPVTHRENILRGESPMAQQARRTHCPEGHRYDEANTIIDGGKRKCRICKNSRRRKNQ